MIKNVLIYSFIFFSLFLVTYSLHVFYLDKEQIILSFSLKKVYLFHLVFSLLICINFLIFSTIDKVFQQLGFIYLGTILLKLTLFAIIFYKSIFLGSQLSFTERLSLFIPMFIFLITEAILVSRVLSKNNK